MQTRISLEQIRVAEPCQVPWASMSGDERTRFCSHCQKHVHNLSAMTQDEAERAICANAGSLCVRYVADAHGAPLTLEYAPPTPPSRWRRVWPVACLAALAAGAVSFIKKPAPQPAILGFIAVPTVQPVSPDPASEQP